MRATVRTNRFPVVCLFFCWSCNYSPCQTGETACLHRGFNCGVAGSSMWFALSARVRQEWCGHAVSSSQKLSVARFNDPAHVWCFWLEGETWLQTAWHVALCINCSPASQALVAPVNRNSMIQHTLMAFLEYVVCVCVILSLKQRQCLMCRPKKWCQRLCRTCSDQC